jgi:Cytochrome P450
MRGESFPQSHSRSSSAQFAPRAMLRDENDYSDPESFTPERYLKNGLPDLTVRDPATIMFGFGRRWVFLLHSLAQQTFAIKTPCSVCPAAHMGLSTVWIMAASMLSAFEFLKPLDEYGAPIDPTIEYNCGLTLYELVSLLSKLCLFANLWIYIFNRKPKPFKCRFQPRHEGVEALIRSNINSDSSCLP